MHSILERQYWMIRSQVHTVQRFHQLPEFMAISEDEKRSIKLLKGHIPYGLHRYLEGESEYFSMMRDPVSRTISAYYYDKSSIGTALTDKMLKENISLKQYLQEQTTPWLFDAQTKHLAGVETKQQMRQPCTEELYQKALNHIDNHFILVGLTHYFDESILLLKKKLRWSWPFYKKENVTKKPKAKQPVSEEIKQLIEETNLYDVKLFKHVEQRFKEELRYGGSFFSVQAKFFKHGNKLYQKVIK